MIGVFDSGYGGLTVLREFVKKLPQYDFMYLGDNARTPYGSRSFETVYRFTLENVNFLFNQGCRLVILACNTASAKALRTIQQKDLPRIDPDRRVLGVIRPVAEYVARMNRGGKVGVLGTRGTVASESYPIEIHHQNPEMMVYQEACPLWVPLIENGEYDSPGADYFVKKHMDHLFLRNKEIDTLILGCTHYPLLINKIKMYLPEKVQIVDQGKIVAESLQDYLQRHPEMDSLCEKNGQRVFYTTDRADLFDQQAEIFFGEPVASKQIFLF
jgi:glutamate racemase